MKFRGTLKNPYTYNEVRQGNWSSFKAPPPIRAAPGLGQDGQHDGQQDGHQQDGGNAWAGYQTGAWSGYPPPPGPPPPYQQPQQTQAQQGGWQGQTQ